MTSERIRIRRFPARAAYDVATIRAILDEGLVCHVGFVVEGQPYVIPTTYARVQERLYIHGSTASRMLRTLSEEVPVCVTVTLLDGLVLARSAFNHSMNYRSVVILGRAVEVTDPVERIDGLRAIVEHIVPGRWAEVRSPSDRELQGTRVLRVPLGEASAKVRTGPPLDDEEDYQRQCWAGEIPLKLVPCAPVPDPRLDPRIAASEAVCSYRGPAAIAWPTAGRG